jgi:2-polyprenyl-6-methoxyphenol hydroxylase-like FAD-dependent oxidoreductase
MLSALVLAEAGVNVRIIDQETRTTSRTYACALHPSTLAILDRLQLSRELQQAGRRVTSVGFFEGEVQRANVALSALTTQFPFVLVLPQSSFETLLEQQLKKAGVRVDWNHQLSGLQTQKDGVTASIQKLVVSAKGYIIPEMDWEVEKTEQVRVEYVVGADGPNSSVARLMNLGSDSTGTPEFFAVYEFQADADLGDELRVVLDKETGSVLWPLPDNRCRWSFQLLQQHLAEFPSKERSRLILGNVQLDTANRQFIDRLVRERAPWFKAKVQEILWSTDVEFEHRVTKRFGNDRCWLAGDAAHQTSPGGMQSMNAGLAEAESLAWSLIKLLQAKATASELEGYNNARLEQWRRLLGLKSTIKTQPKTPAWVRENRSRILPFLPATGVDLVQLLEQLGLVWE